VLRAQSLIALLKTGNFFCFFLNATYWAASKLSVKAEIRATPVQFFLCFLDPEHVARIISRKNHPRKVPACAIFARNCDFFQMSALLD